MILNIRRRNNLDQANMGSRSNGNIYDNDNILKIYDNDNTLLFLSYYFIIIYYIILNILVYRIL